MSDVFADIKFETKVFDRRLKKILEIAPKILNDAIDDGIEAFTQSAVKKTPQSKKKRGIIPLSRPGSGKVYRYKVPYRTAKKRGAKYLSKKREAGEFAKIDYRGIGKYAWLVAGQKAANRAIRVSFKPSAKVASKENEIQATMKARRGLFPYSILTNKVYGIGNYASYIAIQSIRAANNRLKWYIKKYKQKAKAAWR